MTTTVDGAPAGEQEAASWPWVWDYLTRLVRAGQVPTPEKIGRVGVIDHVVIDCATIADAQAWAAVFGDDGDGGPGPVERYGTTVNFYARRWGWRVTITGVDRYVHHSTDPDRPERRRCETSRVTPATTDPAGVTCPQCLTSLVGNDAATIVSAATADDGTTTNTPGPTRTFDPYDPAQAAELLALAPDDTTPLPGGGWIARDTAQRREIVPRRALSLVPCRATKAGMTCTIAAAFQHAAHVAHSSAGVVAVWPADPAPAPEHEDERAALGPALAPGDRVVSETHDGTLRGTVTSVDLDGETVWWDTDAGVAMMGHASRLRRESHADLTLNELADELAGYAGQIGHPDAQYQPAALGAARIAEELLRRLRAGGAS